MIDQIIQDIETHGYAFMPQAVSPEDLIQINAFFDERKSEFKPAKVWVDDGPKRAEQIRGDYTFWLDPLNPEFAFKDIIHFLNELKDKMNAHFYLGLKQFECHLAYYPAGTFYKKHIDKVGAQSGRALSFVFYLHEEWIEGSGGELVIYDKKNNILDTIYPRPGSLICFLSEDYPHEVKSGNFERRSLTGWMHTKIIY